jgi:hypothetical protein
MSDEARDNVGRFVKGHHIGRPRKPRPVPRTSPVALAFQAAGTPVDDARRLLVSSLLEGAKAKDVGCMRLLASLIMPKGRTLDFGLFEGAENAEQRAAAVVGALGVGALSPAEAQDTIAVVKVQAEAGEWREVRELHELAKGGGTRVLPGAGSGGSTAHRPVISGGSAAAAIVPVDGRGDSHGHE